MNAHQRRKNSRHNHMALPLGKAIRIQSLRGRRVYAYGGLSAYATIDDEIIALIESATVYQHLGNGTLVLMLTTHQHKQHCIQTSMRGIQLVNKSDRAPRPWWSQLRRDAKAGAA